MAKTGIQFIDGFSLFIVFLPLLPLCIVLARQIFRDALLNFLMILCLLQFIQYFTQELVHISDLAQFSLANLFSLLETILYILIFRPFFKGKSRDMLNFLIIAFLSSLITYYLLRGTDHKRAMLTAVQYGFILALIGFCLPKMVMDDDLNILQSAFFWIAVGTSFYLVVGILVELADHWWKSMSNANDKALIMDIANLVRYIAYTCAAVLHQPKMIEKERDGGMPF